MEADARMQDVAREDGALVTEQAARVGIGAIGRGEMLARDHARHNLVQREGLERPAVAE